MIPDSFYSDVGYDRDGFEGGPTLDWIKANREVIDTIVSQAAWKIVWGLQGAGTIMSADNNGVHLHIVRNHYAKCCLVDTEYLDVIIAWEDLLVGRADSVIDAAWEKQHEKERQEKECERKRALDAQSMAERLQYERLKAKYET